MRWEIRGAWPTIEEIERRFDELIRWRWGPAVPEPPVDVYVVDDEIVVEMDLPGVEEADLRVRLEGTRLVVEGARPLRVPAKAARPARLERAREFRRTVALPHEIGEAQLEVRLEHGVLRARVRWESRR